MKRVLKIGGLFLGVTVGILVLAFTLITLRIEGKRTSKIDVTVSSFALPSDPESIAEGKRLVQVKACADCHGADLAGKTFINEPPIGVLSGPNLTPGKGSVVSNYQTEDWIRSIRYGIGTDGRPLIAMPAGDYHGMSNQDLGRVIAYLKTIEPVDRENPPQKVGPVARVLYALNKMPLLFPYEEVNLTATPIEKVEPAPTAEYGQYLAQACTGCHGPGFSGGRIPGTPPAWPAAGNISPSGRISQWTLADFKKTLTEGVTPDGKQIDPQFMPWKSMQAMTDLEIEAVYAFLKQVPPRAEGTR